MTKLFLGQHTSLPRPAHSPHHSHAAQLVGLALIVLPVEMIAAATVRYLHHRKAIAIAAQTDYGSTLADMLLALMLVCLGVFLIVYVAHQLLLAGP